MKVYELHYSATNTYLIEGEKGRILFDTGWAGTFPAFCKAMGEIRIPVQSVDYILISHFHPDHMGIAQEIADLGPVIAVMDVQVDFVHSSDAVFAKERNMRFIPIRDDKIRRISLRDSRAFLLELGIEGEILHTPGHSEDSVSLCLDNGTLFAGDLNPLYELELHEGTKIAESWKKLLDLHPSTVFYGHARAAALRKQPDTAEGDKNLYELVKRIMKYIDKGISVDRICGKTGSERDFVENVARMYLTHQNVGVQGILDRIELRGRTDRKHTNI